MTNGTRVRVLLINCKAAMAGAIVARPDLDAIVLAEDRHREHFTACGCGQAISELPYLAGDKISPRAIRSVRIAIQRHQPDVVHAFYPRALSHAVLATPGLRWLPKIVSYRGVTAPAPWWSPVQWISYRSPRVDLHACESMAVQHALVTAGVPAERCAVAYNCLTSPVQTYDRSEARQRWGVPQDAFVVATAANMRPVKGGDVLVQAALACADLTDVHFVLMGRIHDRRVTRLAANPRATRVHLAGFTPDASRLVSAADVFVMPSRAEALSVALLEAMTQGVCPVVSDAGGMKEAVQHGQDGLVFSSGDAAELAGAIRMLHGNAMLRKRLGASAQQRAAAEFSAAAVAGRLAGMYQRVVGAEPRRALRRSA
jgi:glycosyltransferase involved in cell wall biosynthesis